MKYYISKIIRKLPNLSVNEFVDKINKITINTNINYINAFLEDEIVSKIIFDKMFKEADGNEYEYFYDILKLDVDNLLIVINNNLSNIKSYNHKLLLELLEYITWKDINKVLLYALEHEDFYDYYFSEIKYFYSLCYNVKYDTILKYLEKDANIVKEYFSIYKEDYIKLFKNPDLDYHIKMMLLKKCDDKLIKKEYKECLKKIKNNKK